MNVNNIQAHGERQVAGEKYRACHGHHETAGQREKEARRYCCATLHCTAPNCILMCCTISRCTQLHYNVLHFTILYCIEME